MKIVPTLEYEDIDSLRAHLSKLEPYFDRFSIDVQDGQVVPTKTVTTTEVLEHFKAHPAKNLVFDFDLMVYNYSRSLQDILELKNYVSVGNIVIFQPALKGEAKPIQNDLSIGLSLDVQDTVEGLAHRYNLSEIPCIQIMTIHAGPQGSPFISEMLNKIDQLRALDYRSNIYTDGGVTKNVINILVERQNLPDFVCVGSFLSKAGDELQERIKLLKSVEK